MKPHTLLRLVGLLTLLVCVAGIPLYGQERHPATQEPQPSTQDQQPAAQEPQPSTQDQQPTAQEPQPSTQEPSQSPDSSMSQESNENQPAQMFMGKIAKSKGDLVLKGEGGISYKLDNTDEAKQWVGKKVKVTGKLDTATNTIHVVNIEAPSS